ncbi:MAG: hypothetical protein AB7U20_21390 [Planctomycetaceae bacterium]
MSVSLRRGLLVLLTALVPVGAEACCLFNPFDTCGVCGPRPWIGFTVGLPLPFPCGCGCGPCAPPPLCGPPLPPPNFCGCGPVTAPAYGVGPSLPAPIPTGFNCAVQPVTTYRNVPTTHVRRETYIENVPVTTYQQVTVPQTVYQPQVRYRDVAYTVNQQIAETRTPYIPQPRISYAPSMPMASTGCSTCDSPSGYGLSTQLGTPGYPTAVSSVPYIGLASGPVPTPIALPPATALRSSQPATLDSPQPYAESPWQTVPQRQAQQSTEIQQMGGFYPSYSPPPVRSSRPMFQPAPSAASVWQSPWRR